MTSSNDPFESVELDPELVPCVVTTASGLTMLSHPLLHTVYTPHMNTIYNETLHYKRESLDKCLKHSPHQWIWFHERPYRLEAFISLVTDGYINTHEEFSKLLKDIWIDTENMWQHKELWRKMLRHKLFAKTLFMSSDDYKEFRKLPKNGRITIYRGVHAEIPRMDGDERFGLSWTLNPEVAEFFANRLRNHKTEQAQVISAQVHKNSIDAFLSDRGEDEIVISKLFSLSFIKSKII